MLNFGGERAGAVVILVVAFARIDADEVVLDGPLHVTRHVVIDGGKTDGHADRLVVAEQGTVGLLHLRIAEVDAGDVVPASGIITDENAVQTVLAQRTRLTEAERIGVCLRREDFLTSHGVIG